LTAAALSRYNGGKGVDTMLDEKDLEIIARLNSESEQRMMVMMEAYFEPKFNALSEMLSPVPKEQILDMDDRLDDVEKTVELHTRQIAELKKAQ
jgi:hypothetical protein